MFEHISVPVDKIIDEVASIAGRDVAALASDAARSAGPVLQGRVVVTVVLCCLVRRSAD